MNEKFLKRGYYFPPEVLDKWEKFHAPSKDYSPSAAGAFLVWMTLDASVREKARKSALMSDLAVAMDEVQLALAKNIADTEIKQFLDSLTPSQRRQVLADAKESEKKVSGKE